MHKIIRALFAIVLSVLIVSPVYAEESDTVEFMLSGK